MNIVELLADDDDCAFDQPCKYAHRVETHAAYCHAGMFWKDAPRKCPYWRNASPANEWEECEGFDANSLYVPE